MEYIYLLIAAIVLILVGIFIYIRKNKEASAQIEETPSERVAEEIEADEPESEDDDSHLNPKVSEVEDGKSLRAAITGLRSRRT